MTQNRFNNKDTSIRRVLFPIQDDTSYKHNSHIQYDERSFRTPKNTNQQISQYSTQDQDQIDTAHTRKHRPRPTSPLPYNLEASSYLTPKRPNQSTSFDNSNEKRYFKYNQSNIKPTTRKLLYDDSKEEDCLESLQSSLKGNDLFYPILRSYKKYKDPSENRKDMTITLDNRLRFKVYEDKSIGINRDWQEPMIKMVS